MSACVRACVACVRGVRACGVCVERERVSCFL